MFSSPAQMMGKRESNLYDNPNARHNKFYREVIKFYNKRKYASLTLFNWVGSAQFLLTL